ncbi:hypothetical protein [Engelhardtia mirabilis]
MAALMAAVEAYADEDLDLDEPAAPRPARRDDPQPRVSRPGAPGRLPVVELRPPDPRD